MPRVGSSTISTSAPAASHLPSTTFCWLPPLRATTRCRRPRRAGSAARSIQRSASERSAARSTSPAATELRQLRQRQVRRHTERRHEAHDACGPPARARCRRESPADGVRSVTAARRPGRGPTPAVSAPAITRASSVRPAPSKPATPRISPRRSVRLTSRSRDPRDTPSTRRTRRRRCRAGRGKCSVDVAVHHQPHELRDRRRELTGRHDLPVAQHGGAVTDRARAPPSGGKCRRPTTPLAVSRRMAANSCSISRLGQRRGRLVHDQDPALEGERLRHFDHLLLGDAERPHRRARVDRSARGSRAAEPRPPPARDDR